MLKEKDVKMTLAEADFERLKGHADSNNRHLKYEALHLIREAMDARELAASNG